MTTDDKALRAEGVSRRFGAVQALDGVTLAAAPGERVALIGHNGAGKTTLIRLALGFARPDAGRLEVAGAAPGSEAARRATAYLPESVVFPKTLTGREVARLYARLKGATRAEADAALARVGLADAADRRAGTYSKGMRQRLGLAQALVGRPRLMLLDEPTSGLDPASRAELYALIDEAAAQGTAVLLSSHSLEEIETRTDRVAILRKGRLLADAPLAELQAQAALPIRIRLSARADAADEVSARLGGARINGCAVELLVPPADKMARLREIGALGTAVTDVELRPPSLDEIYRHVCAAAESKEARADRPEERP